MGYCAFTDIEQDFKGTVFLAAAASPTSIVTQEAVSQFIVEGSALIDSYVGQRWVTPITADDSALALMSLYCRTLVAARVRGILSNKQTTNVDANQNVKADGLSVTDVMKALAAIASGTIQLSGATLVLENAGFYSNTQSMGTTGRFRKNQRQW